VMLRLPDHHPAGAVVARFAEEGIHADARGQTLRLSPGVMTTEDGVARLLDCLRSAME
jgi:kynureninase